LMTNELPQEIESILPFANSSILQKTIKPTIPVLCTRAAGIGAPLQFAFYTGKQFPEAYRGGAFIAEHGSWNRSPRTGYQVVFVGFKDGKPSVDPAPFITGLVPNPADKNVNGRPVGVAVAADGALLISDDGSGMIYRITYAQ